MKTKNLKLEGTPEEREREYHEKYLMVFLDKECYTNDAEMTTFIILTREELNMIRKNTLKRMEEYNKNVPEFAGFGKVDIERLKGTYMKGD